MDIRQINPAPFPGQIAPTPAQLVSAPPIGIMLTKNRMTNSVEIATSGGSNPLMPIRFGELKEMLMAALNFFDSQEKGEAARIQLANGEREAIEKKLE